MFIIWWWCYRHLAVGEHAVGILGTFIRYFGVVFFCGVHLVFLACIHLVFCMG